MNLHSYWDGLVLPGNQFDDARKIAAIMLKRPDFAPARLTELVDTDFEQWAKASFKLAKRHAYRDGKVVGSVERNDAPVAPADYAKEAKAVAERQMVLAGYRLARVLHDAF